MTSLFERGVVKMQKFAALLLLSCLFKIDFAHAGVTYFYDQSHLICAPTSNPFLENANGITFHLNGAETSTDIKFDEKTYQSIPELKSDETVFDFIKGTKHHHVIKSTTKIYMNANGDIINVENDETQIDGKSIQVCEEQVVKRQSGEHIAINILTALNQSYLSLKSIGELNGLTPTTVYTHPETLDIKEVYDSETRELKETEQEVMTDNAFYWNDGMYFIPHSEDYIKFMQARGLKHINFWETSFVASHEFGHKIFEHNFPSGTKRMSLMEVIKGRSCFSDNWKRKYNPNKNQRALTKSDILGAFNEGFADMFAYYSLESAFSSLKNVPWFEKERDVESLIDEANQRKQYNKRVADAFFLDHELNYRTDPDAKFQDDHTIGAIFAANINYFMDGVGISTKSQKLKITMLWLKSLQTHFEEDQKLSEYAFLFKVVERYVDEVKAFLGQPKLTPKQKSLLVEGFPHYQFEIMQNL